MEQQHPIPQEISSYQFRLVGDMTLNQFFQLAGGLLFALLIYASGLHPFIKWPLIVFFGSLGAALAFLPFEERPLSKWIVVFFKSIYSPTIFNWQKSSGKDFFLPEGAPAVAPAQPQKHPEARHNPVLKKFEEAETAFLSKITGLFSSKTAPVTPVQQTAPAPAPAEVAPKPAPPTVEQAPYQTSVDERGVIQAPRSDQDASLRIPKLDYVKYEKNVGETKRPKMTVEEQDIIYQKQPDTNITPVVQDFQKSTTTTKATFSSEAAPPSPPTKPNTVVGQVFGPNGKIVEAAILEIKDSNGRPVRAVKTNKLGHFLIVTSLDNGEYEIITEKEGVDFEPVKFDAKGGIIPPIAINARKKVKVEEKK